MKKSQGCKWDGTSYITSLVNSKSYRQFFSKKYMPKYLEDRQESRHGQEKKQLDRRILLSDYLKSYAIVLSSGSITFN